VERARETAWANSSKQIAEPPPRHRRRREEGRARRQGGAAEAAAAAMGVMEKLKIFVVKEPVVAASCLIAGFGTRPIPSAPLWPKP